MEPDPVTVAGTLLVAVLAGLVVRRRLLFVTLVDSCSMVPALAPGRRVLTRRLGRTGRIRRGDVLVVTSHELGRPVVKRVLGLPGEQVVIGSTGRLSIDGRDVAEPYVVHPGGPGGTFRVPPRHLLLLGDNRACSDDGRHWRCPYLPVTAVRGKVVSGLAPPPAARHRAGRAPCSP